MGMNTDAVQRLYVAYFNRPADPVSLAVFEAMLPSDRVATQAELQVIAETYFSPSAEYTARYSGMSNAEIINTLYQNLFGRDAEPAGLLSWTGKLNTGAETVASIALQLSYSAQGTDADAIAAKIEAANKNDIKNCPLFQFIPRYLMSDKYIPTSPIIRPTILK